MKVIFLDIDGVLNHENHYKWLMETDEPTPLQRFYPYSEFNPESFRILNKIIDETDAKIVLSSSWRLDGINRMNSLFKYFGLPRIYDITPSLCNKFGSLCRGKEIDAWLNEHPEVTKYVILDDDTDMEEHQLPFFIKTNPYKDGLNEEVKNKCIKILNF
jgi:hypothetical protein